MSHIQGPMLVTPSTNPVATENSNCAIWGPDGDLIALVWENLALEADAEDTAALFAASPELLSDLKLATRSVRILSEMLLGERRKQREEIKTAAECIAKYERTIQKATTRQVQHGV